MQLFATVLSATLYAIMISVGYGKRMDDAAVTRPLVVAGGVMIVIGGYAWFRRSWDVFNELFKWFAYCSLPILLRSAILFFNQADQDALDRHRLPR